MKAALKLHAQGGCAAPYTACNVDAALPTFRVLITTESCDACTTGFAGGCGVIGAASPSTVVVSKFTVSRTATIMRQELDSICEGEKNGQTSYHREAMLDSFISAPWPEDQHIHCMQLLTSSVGFEIHSSRSMRMSAGNNARV